MARRFYTPLDLQQLELLRPRLEQRTGDPTSGVEGQVFYNTTTDKIRLCTATGSPGTWVDVLLGPVTSADIADGTIVNIDIGAAAAIAYSKLALTNAIVNGDIAAAAAIAYSKLNLLNSVTNGDLAGGIALSKLATDPLARANHTGTQLAATISNFDTQVRTSRLDQMAVPTAPVAMGAQKITGLADGTAATDAVTKQQLDASTAGLDVKASVRVASTANVTVAAPGSTPADGVALSNGDRILLKNQTTGSENGIYVFNGAAVPLTRATDADTSAEVTPGLFTFVEEGTTLADTGWVLSTNAPIVLGTTALAFTQFSGPGTITAGAGLSQAGNTLSVANNGITNAMIADGAINVGTADVTGTLPVANGGTGAITAAAARTSLAVPGRYDNGAVHGAGTTITIAAATHGLGTGRSKLVQIIEEATGDIVEADVNVATTGDVVCTFAAALAANAMRVLILGF
jgi:hypothetical protein